MFNRRWKLVGADSCCVFAAGGHHEGRSTKNELSLTGV